MQQQKPITTRKKLDKDFNAIALTVASPEQILSWSSWEVQRPETINYRTQRPEKDWLFCEKIFWPIKNWECSCWKYKRIRYKWVICERCWVEVTRSVVRRERMAHVDLAVPVAHTWYVRSTPSRVWLLLDLPVKALEQIIYFAAYIVTNVDLDEKVGAANELEEDFRSNKKKVKEDFWKEINELKEQIASWEEKESALDKLKAKQAEIAEEIEVSYSDLKKALESLYEWQVLTEVEWRDLSMKFWHVFSASTWAESIRKMLERIDLNAFWEELKEAFKASSGQKQKKLIKRIRLTESLRHASIKPEWLILTNLPILPPDLRPMVQLDGWRFATSDLNDLYRRVINRNNRLKRLMSIWAPEVISRNEKRMLQEAVDTLLNNSPRAWKAVFTTWERRKLRSLSDMLKWKQGRFRQNLLWKRVDYSGRSVIVVWPDLKIDEMWMPKEMALKLFKPFVIWKLLTWEYAFNVKAAEKLIQNNEKIVWDILEWVIEWKYVLLNRAPTLHRLWIQAFMPRLVEWKAMRLHPLVCAAFNADFDGDQMAVHLPLSDEAQREAREIMSAATNILKPASGQPIVTPTQDMILWIYYLTQSHKWRKWEWTVFLNLDESLNSYRQWFVDLQANVKIRVETKNWLELLDTTVGRAIFNSVLPVKEIWFSNKVFKKGDIWELINEVFVVCWEQQTAKIVDEVKRVWFEFATKSWLSISAFDLQVPVEKQTIIKETEEFVNEIFNKYDYWLITDEERYTNTIKAWSDAKNKIADKMINLFKKDPENHIYYMIDSWARWNWGQITQLCWMKWLVANPSGRTIELPIKSNLKEWFTILEFFNATHGWRKWKSDTALKTAEAGYLTRRLVDAVQDIIIKYDDCWSEGWTFITKKESEEIWEKFEHRIYWRTIHKDIINKEGDILWKVWGIIDHYVVKDITKYWVEKVEIRSILNCVAENWICKKCYWADLWNSKVVEEGAPVWIVAAQAIWEPGTQLTMRTFHSWWVVSDWWDITQGLTRVEELFEARPPKTPAVLSEIWWKISLSYDWGINTVTVKELELWEDFYKIPCDYNVVVKKWDLVKEKQIICKSNIDKNTVKVKNSWKVVNIDEFEITIKHDEKQVRLYNFKHWEFLKVDDWDLIEQWSPLNLWHFNLRELMWITNVYNVQKYMTKEVQKIYAQQWQTINDKHIELIIKQMFSKVKVNEPWNTKFLTWEVVDFIKYERVNREIRASWKSPASWERLLLWLTRLALATDSWLSASSFQETIRVLVEASITKKVDFLKWLKENVIIGKLIPVWDIYTKNKEEK